MHEFKYSIFESKSGYKLVIVHRMDLQHVNTAYGFLPHYQKRCGELEPVSGGFAVVHDGQVHCHGYSHSLKVKSIPTDAVLLNQCIDKEAWLNPFAQLHNAHLIESDSNIH